MCNHAAIELANSMYRRACKFYLTRPWGMNIDPLMLTIIFESLPEKTEKITVGTSTISVGDRVTLLDFQEEECCTLTIVTPMLSTPEKGDISFLSPLGAILLKKKAGDIITINALGSQLRYQVIKIDQPIKYSGGDSLA